MTPTPDLAGVLTADSTVSCPHTPGKVQTPIASKARLSVKGKAVLTADAVLAPITGCTVSDSQSTAQCRKVAVISTGQATKLTVNKVAVLLETLTGFTNGAPPVPPAGPPVTATAGQNLLKAV